jgi:F420-dependent hydroxymycolic acid dehydrogenase
LSLLYAGRVFLGVGSGEAVNEEAATGLWPKWPERWERLIEAIGIIRALWDGEQVAHHGKYYNIEAKLYDPPPQPIPLLTAANGRKSMRLAGQHGDGLITDPRSWKQYKSEWEGGARDAGKNPADMPVLVEQFVVVGDQDEARQAAEFWRFLPKGFKKYYNIADPAEIPQQADREVPLEQIVSEWRSVPIPRSMSRRSTNCSRVARQSSISTRGNPTKRKSSNSTRALFCQS